MRTRTLLCILTLVVAFSSCQKESDSPDPNGNEELYGTWNFVGMDLSVRTMTVNGSGVDQEKMVGSYTCPALNPAGTLTIDAKKFITNGITYSVDTEVAYELYSGGVLFDSFEMPLQATMPPSSASATYDALGTDSVYLHSGLITFDPGVGGGSPMNTIPQGFKISWLKDTLVLKSVISHSDVQNIGGIISQVKIDASQTVKLKK